MNGPNIDKFCIEQYRCWRDPDLMKVYVEYVKECIRSFPKLIFDSPLLSHIIECICDAFANLNSYEM
jgi:transportin-3